MKKIFLRNIYFSIWLAAGLILIAAICFKLGQSLHESLSGVGLNAFNRSYLILEEKVNSYVYGLQGIGGIYVVTRHNPTKDQLRSYAQFRNFFSNFPGVLGFGFIRNIPREKLPSYVNAQQRLNVKFQIKTLGTGPDDAAMIIEDIEPTEVNHSAIGLDISTEQNRLNAARTATASGKATLTKSITLVQLDQENKGFLFLLPIYQSSHTPLTSGERRSQIIGWVYTPLLISGISNHLKSTVHPLLSLSVFDVSEGAENELLISLGTPTKHSYERTLVVGGRTWKITGAFVDEGRQIQIVIVPLLIFLSLSFFFVGMSLLVRKLLTTSGP